MHRYHAVCGEQTLIVGGAYLKTTALDVSPDKLTLATSFIQTSLMSTISTSSGWSRMNFKRGKSKRDVFQSDLLNLLQIDLDLFIIGNARRLGCSEEYT